MAAKNSMPERVIAQTENADLEIQQENREKLRKKRIRALHNEPVHSAYLHERGEAGSACVNGAQLSAVNRRVVNPRRV